MTVAYLGGSHCIVSDHGGDVLASDDKGIVALVVAEVATD